MKTAQYRRYFIINYMCMKCTFAFFIFSMENETTYQAVLGRLIIQKRSEKQIDQKDMAKHVGVSRSTWSRIEGGSSALNMDQLTRVANKLGMPLGELMLEADRIVEQLIKQGVTVHHSRDQVKSKKESMATVAFLGGAVLGGIVTALLASKSSNGPQLVDEEES